MSDFSECQVLQEFLNEFHILYLFRYQSSIRVLRRRLPQSGSHHFHNGNVLFLSQSIVELAALVEWHRFLRNSPAHDVNEKIAILMNTSTQVRWQSLCDAIRLLGCFTNEIRLIDSQTSSSSKFDYASKPNYDIFEQLFYSLDERHISSVDLPLELINACHIARCFHDIALDCIDK